MQASIADGDFSQLAADLTVLVKLRLQLDNFVPRTVGSTRSSCNTNIAHIDVSAQLLSRLPGPVRLRHPALSLTHVQTLTNLDTAVRTGNQAQSSSSFKNAAELGGALRTGVSVGGPYGGPSQSALVQLNAGIQSAVNVVRRRFCSSTRLTLAAPLHGQGRRVRRQRDNHPGLARAALRRTRLCGCLAVRLDRCLHRLAHFRSQVGLIDTRAIVTHRCTVDLLLYTYC